MKLHLKSLVILTSLAIVLAGCGPKKNTPQFSDDNAQPAFPTLIDSAGSEKVNITKEFKLNSEVALTYKTAKPEGTGTVTYKIKSVKPLEKIGDMLPEDGKKLILVEFSYKGSIKNVGRLRSR